MVLFAKDANFIGYATTNQFLSFSSMPIANPSIFQTCIASPHDIISIQKDCTCTTSRFFFTRKQRGFFLRWRKFFLKKKSVPGSRGKFSVSGATRKVFSGPISDFSVSKFKNSKKIIKTKTGFFRPDFVSFRSDFGAFRAENIVLAM